MEKETEANEKKGIKIKYKTVMEIIIAIELLILVGTIIYGFIK